MFVTRMAPLRNTTGQSERYHKLSRSGVRRESEAEGSSGVAVAVVYKVQFAIYGAMYAET